MTCSSPLGVSWGNVRGGGGRGSTNAALVSGCDVSVFVARAAVLAVFRAATTGEVPSLVRAAAAAAAAWAAWRSFFLLLSSAPRLELRGRLDEGGERLGARLL